MEKEKINQLTFNEEMSITNNRYVYNKCHTRKFSSCGVCSPGRGCNRNRMQINNNWKEHRKRQYKNGYID